MILEDRQNDQSKTLRTYDNFSKSIRPRRVWKMKSAVSKMLKWSPAALLVPVSSTDRFSKSGAPRIRLFCYFSWNTKFWAFMHNLLSFMCNHECKCFRHFSCFYIQLSKSGTGPRIHLWSQYLYHFSKSDSNTFEWESINHGIPSHISGYFVTFVLYLCVRLSNYSNIHQYFLLAFVSWFDIALGLKVLDYNKA